MCEFPAVASPSDKQTDHLEEWGSCGTQSLWDVSTVAQRAVGTGLDKMDTLLTWRTSWGQVSAILSNTSLSHRSHFSCVQSAEGERDTKVLKMHISASSD